MIAPALVPRKAGDRVKTDRRDAEKLARSYRSGDLTAVWVPDAGHEALRDLVRAREAAKKDQLRARHRLQKLLIRRGIRPPEGMKAWTERHYKWVKSLTLEPIALEATRLDYVTEVDHVRERIVRLERAIDEAIETAPERMRAVVEGLQALRGVAKITAATIVAELGSPSRFESPRLLMGYSGAVPREHSSAGNISRGPITKTGNSHLRRVIVEASWAYQHKPSLYRVLQRRQANVSEEVKAISMKAQHRLHGRYRKLTGRGKSHQHAMMAVARELLGFIWAIATHIERQHEAAERKAA